MPSALPLPAPSPTLLRFLRSQSRGISFFAPNKGPACAVRRSAKTLPPQLYKASRSPKRPVRPLCMSKPRRSEAVLQAGLFDLDSLLPKSLGRQQDTKTAGPLGDLRGERRYASTDSSQGLYKQSWQDRLWGNHARKGGKGLTAEDLRRQDELETNSMFSARRMQTAKAALEPRLRCTEVDEAGKVILVDGEFKKSELIAKYGLLTRDLRKIDSSNLPHILVRPSAILINLLHLKVLIKYDRVLLFDVYGTKTSYPQSAFMYDLQGKLQQKQAPGSGRLPYEFRALEAVLMSVTSELEADFDTIREPIIRVLSELEDDIDRDKLRILLVLSKRVSTFEQKAKLVRDAIDELLEADDDLAAMYLTEKRHDLYRGEDDHTEIEMLLESYHKICDEVVQEAGNLVTSIRNTEEVSRAILDANRNALMLLDLKFSVGTLGLAMGTFLAGLYGMNLENFIEETNWGFGAVTAVSSVFSVLVCWYGLVKLRKVQRIKMSSNAVRDRGLHWFEDEGPVSLLDARNREKLRRMNMLKAATTQKQRKWF